ncbi:SpaA isopeptide-forming pilin-related protein [Lacticaseibacillus daqingensis]|uniref:SpaA isopeptide-forming pilin-related protein n=1 Tax=Lacticaseibacillus daqingensis TaxID=2486014 RepID=UPI000F79BA25|nr:SpaA isopeptide-forming pilin-related protein [Lacticaseibacillus daqingensis]
MKTLMQSNATRTARRRRGKLRQRLTSLMMMLVILVPFAQAFVAPAQKTNAGTVGSRLPVSYEQKEDGTYPTYYWTTGSGDSTVRNHTGGQEKPNPVLNEGAQAYTEAADETFLKFGADSSNPDYKIRKFATPVEGTNGLYNVNLDVYGNQVENKTSVAIELVVDMSGSMKDGMDDSGVTRRDAVVQGITSFINAVQDQYKGKLDRIQLGAIAYSSDGRKYTNFSVPMRALSESATASMTEQVQATDRRGNPETDWRGNPVYETVSVEKEASQGDIIINQFENASANGGTFTQKALRNAKNALDNSNSANKMMVLLTDGVPTYAYGNDGGTIGSGSSDGTKGGKHAEKTWPGTIAEATSIKNGGVEIHALGIQLEGPSDQTDLSTLQIADKMRQIASPDQYAPANTADEVEDYLLKQASIISAFFDTVSGGTITDPIGDAFTFDQTANPTVTWLTPDNHPDALPTVFEDNGQVSVSGLTLGKDQGVRISYQVRLDTEKDGVTPGVWYQMNGRTTLTPNTTDPVVDFGVPSAKAPATTIKVHKNWQSLGLKDTEAPTQVTVTVRRTSTAGTTKDESLTLTKDSEWAGSLTEPLYDRMGNAFTYEVLQDETADVSLDTYIQQAPDIAPGEIEITNRQYGVEMQKWSTDPDQQLSGDDLSGLEFTLHHYTDGNFSTEAEAPSVTDGALQALQPGFYGIQETGAPQGYQLDTKTYLFQLTDQGQWLSFGERGKRTDGTPVNADGTDLGQVGDQQDRQDQLIVSDKHPNILQLKKYDEPLPSLTLRIAKTDELGQYLKGADFMLTPPGGKAGKVTSNDQPKGVAFEAKLQAGETYTVKETKAPFGYRPNATEVTIEVADDGTSATVKVGGKPIATDGVAVSDYQLSQDGRTLTLKVKNHPIVVLPHTGGSGWQSHLGLALVLLAFAAVMAAVVSVERREVRNHD